MKIEIKRIVRPLLLSEFAPEYGDTAVMVWINPTKSLTDRWYALSKRANDMRQVLQAKVEAEASADEMREPLEQLTAAGNEIIAWLAEIWSQGPEETRFSEQDIKTLIETCQEEDTTLYRWLMDRTYQMIRDYRVEKKRN